MSSEFEHGAGVSLNPNIRDLERKARIIDRIGVGPFMAIVCVAIIGGVMSALLVGMKWMGSEFIGPTFKIQQDSMIKTAASVDALSVPIDNLSKKVEELGSAYAARSREMESQTKAAWETAKKVEETNVKMDKHIFNQEQVLLKLDRQEKILLKGFKLKKSDMDDDYSPN